MTMRRSPRLIGTVALLIMALVVSAALAYQGWDAARSQEATVEATLQDYAKLADWELTQQGKNQLLAQVVTSLIRQASAIDPKRLSATMLSPVEIEDVGRETVAWCKCLSGVKYFF